MTNGITDNGLSRRTLLCAGVAATLVSTEAAVAATKPYRRIACEEGFLSPGVLAQNGKTNIPGISLITAEGPSAGLARVSLDLEDQRLRAMDADGIDVQLLMLSAPGVQVFDAATGTAIATEANDYVSAACARHPTRLAALAAVAPQDPSAAARELSRAKTLPGIKGAIINSHTNNRYLDDPFFWPIFEALEGLDMPLYIHPREPAAGMRDIMEGPITGGPAWAYGVEVGTHILRLIQGGVFDRFPKLRIVVGHMGEALPFWLPRIDNRYVEMARLLGQTIKGRLPSAYIKDHVWVTTSGMNYWPQLEMTLRVLGADKVMYATDYPFERQGQAVGFVEAMPLSQAQKKTLFEDNAARVFGL